MPRLISIVFTLLLTLNAAAQNAGSKPLTNDDVVSLLKGGLEEGTVISAMKSQPTQFDLSASALLKLKQEGVGSKVMDAMMASPAPQNVAATAAASGTPSVVLLQAARGKSCLRPKRSWRKPRPSPHLWAPLPATEPWRTP